MGIEYMQARLHVGRVGYRFWESDNLSQTAARGTVPLGGTTTEVDGLPGAINSAQTNRRVSPRVLGL